MFLNLSKQNLLKSKLEKLRAELKKTHTSAVADGVGILVNGDEFSDFESLVKMAEKLVESNQIQLLIYSKNKSLVSSAKQLWFTNSDFKLGGTVKKRELVEFTAQPFAFLISYYQRENVFLDFLKATSRAAFKIGFKQANYDCFNDLSIKTDLGLSRVFETEMIKYLKIVKRID